MRKRAVASIPAALTGGSGQIRTGAHEQTVRYSPPRHGTGQPGHSHDGRGPQGAGSGTDRHLTARAQLDPAKESPPRVTPGRPGGPQGAGPPWP